MSAPGASPSTLRVAGPGDLALLALLAAIWGASFMFIKVAVETIPPLTIVAGRVALGAALLLAVARARGVRLPRDRATWARCAAIAAIGNVAPFALIAWGEARIDSALAAILMSTVPLATVLLAHLLTRDERLSLDKAAGVAVGLAGVAVLIGPGALSGLGDRLLGQLAVVLAACGYALAGIVARGLAGQSAAATGAAVLSVAASVAVPGSLLLDRPWTLQPSAQALGAVAVLGLLCTGAAYLILFRLVTRVGATFLSLNNYLVPLFGVLWGALLLGERLPPRALGALALILAGIAVTQVAARRLARRRAQSPGPERET
jgi:drug/metabolite transporter (DMT)-like permease